MLIRKVDIPITSSDFWQNEDECTEVLLRHVFRSATDEDIPLLPERLSCLREAGQILYQVSTLSAAGSPSLTRQRDFNAASQGA